MDLLDINNKIKDLEEERNNLFELKKPIDIRIVNIHDELKDLYEVRDVECMKNIRNKIDIDLILNGDHKSMVKHREASKQVLELGLHRSGCWSNTNQAKIDIMLEKDNLQKTYDSILFLLPHIKPQPPCKDRYSYLIDGKKLFGVFEYTLSKNGVYYFAILNDNSSQLLIMRYSRVQLLKSFDNIMNGLKYIQKYHYYSEEEEDEI